MLWESGSIAVLWIGFVVYWLIAAVATKKNKKNNLWLKNIGLRLVILAITLLLFKIGVFGSFKKYIHYQFFLEDSVIGAFGVLVAFVGLACTFWARITLGRNWGQPMTEKESPELVTWGPYKYVRHPIYSGVIVAMIGTLLVEGIIWLVPCVGVIIYFFFSAKIEEKNLIKTFPKEYPKYMKHTKMLIPFVV